jgi:hypothetical protein
MAAFAYDPATDTAWTAAFGAGGGVKKITNVSGTQTSAQAISEAQLQLFYRNGNPNLSVSTPLISGMTFNSQPIVIGGSTVPAFGGIWIADINTVSEGGTRRNELTQRLYRYNLQDIPAGGDGRDVLFSLLTKAQLATAAGVASPNTTTTADNFGRQPAFSGDGQSVYAIDSNASFGGIWKINAATGVFSRILNASSATATERINTEPGVLSLGGGVDRILFRGTSTNGNVGGVNYVDHDGTTTSAQGVYLSAADMASFLETTATNGDVRSVVVGPNNDVFIYDQGSERLFRRDSQGRLSKIVTRTERTAFRDQVSKTGTVNANLLRLQPFTGSYNNGSSSFPVTRIAFAETSAQNYVSSIYAFKAGDFNRDNVVDQADLNLFKPVVTVRGMAQTNTGNYKYDMNGNAVVDWKDVKLLQQFIPTLYNGDATMDQKVDVDDLGILASNWQTGGRTWLGADFTGNDFVDVDDLGILASNWQAGVPLGPALAALGLPPVSVPEPSGATAAALVVWLVSRRRRRHQ